MKGQPAFAYNHTKKNEVKVISYESVKADDEVIKVELVLLTQRLLFWLTNMEDDELKRIFAYELSMNPQSLFDEEGYMRLASKPQLAEKLWEFQNPYSDIPEYIAYVLDGGYLIQRISFKKGNSFVHVLKDTHTLSYMSWKMLSFSAFLHKIISPNSVDNKQR